MSSLNRPRCLNPVCEDPQVLARVADQEGHWRCTGCGEVFTPRALARAYGKATGQWIVLAAVLGGVGYPMEATWQQGAVGAAGALGLWAIGRIIHQRRFLQSAP